MIAITDHDEIAGALKPTSNHYARILANRLDIAHVGNSDAHVVGAIGLGATDFEGINAAGLLIALKNKTSKVRKQKERSAFRVLSSWGVRYMESAFVRMTGLARA